MIVPGQPAKLLLAFILLGVLWMLSCAEVQAPPGGEVDKLAPRVDSTVPINGSVNVASGNTIELYFSERVQAGQGKALFLSPRPSKEPRLKWHSDRLTITLAEPFDSNQTYVVTIGSAVTDLRNNPLDSSMTIAFSTGSTLDSGRVSGVVYQGANPQPGAMVGLWNLARLTDTTTIDSLFPDYLTVTSAKGYFNLKYLPEEEYRLIAFADRNRDDRLNVRREALALPDRPIMIGGEMNLDNLTLNLASADTSAVGILSASYNPGGMVRARFSGITTLEYLKAHLSDAWVVSGADSSQKISATMLLELDMRESSSVTLVFGQLSPGEYSLFLPLTADSLVSYVGLMVREGADTEPPTILRHTPTERPAFESDIRIALVFSEPLDTTKLRAETLELLMSDSIRVMLSPKWLDLAHVDLTPDTLLSGAAYKLNIAEFEIADPSGNVMGDSLTAFAMNTLNTDSLGTIVGTIAIGLRDKAADPTVLIFREVANKFTDTVTVKGRDFTVNVPRGKYLLSGFLDSNKDGKRTDGSLHPFRLAETAAVYGDTISVRARFETTGIEMTFK